MTLRPPILACLTACLLLLLAACSDSSGDFTATATDRFSPAPMFSTRATPSPSPTRALAPTATPSPTPVPTPSPSPLPIFHPPPYSVAIDAGHGGPQFGAARNGLIEKDVNMDIAFRLEALLRGAGYTTYLTRAGDYAFVPYNPDNRAFTRADIQARVDYVNENQADILVSVHHNGSDDSSQSGTEVYYNPDRPYGYYSFALADVIQQSLITYLKLAGFEPRDRGVKNDSQVNGDPQNPHSWLLGTNDNFRPSLMPGMIGEALFISNPGDAEQLRKPEIRQAIAEGYKAGIDAYFGWFQRQDWPAQ
ncbi:MAG TPA: N-acetylmuramoyl-L-alanine amidase [Dehalococcoidia bacterium]|nr:N-acetylmuramoyl-L-alanine amidase [Dehalococcoidia bacterium]